MFRGAVLRRTFEQTVVQSNPKRSLVPLKSNKYISIITQGSFPNSHCIIIMFNIYFMKHEKNMLDILMRRGSSPPSGCLTNIQSFEISIAP